MLCFSSTDPNICQIEDKYQKAELIKWILFFKKNNSYIYSI